MIDPQPSSFKKIRIQIRGSELVAPIIQKIGYQYMTDFPSIELILSKASSLHGYKSIFHGTADIGMVSQGMPEELVRQNQDKNAEYKYTLIAHDALAVIVHPSNPIKNLKLSDLKGIFSGRARNWKEFGWNEGGIIELYAPHPSKQSFAAWRRLVMGENYPITIETKTLFDNKEITQAVAKNRQAIAFLSWVPAYEAGSTIVRIEDHYPSSETISKNQYLLNQELQLFSKSDANDHVQRFLDYCTAPNTGQAMIRDMGWISLG
jgi:phosphate transport system substrate-binding protein